MKGRYLGKYLGIAAGIGIAGMALSVQAQTAVQTTPNNYNAPEQAQTAPPSHEHWYEWNRDHERLYRENELSVDLFGVGLLHSSDFNNGFRARHDLRFGGGAGVNYFLTRCIGIGGDFNATTFRHSFVNITTGNLIVRFPLGDTGLAPYVIAGAGYQFQGIDQIVGGGGFGLEFRPCPNFGVFVDARYFAAVKTQDFGMGRAGIRLSF